MPAKPQPRPNNAEPNSRRVSIVCVLGRLTFSPNKLCGFCFAQANTKIPTAIAAIITNANDGSHPCVISKNANTFAGFAMPAKIRPKPNTIPENSALNNTSMFLLGSTFYIQCLSRDALANPNNINVNVATKDRPENRDNPQTPCPLVQPLAKRVPTPASKPAIISTILLDVTVMLGSRNKVCQSNGAINKPSKNAIRQKTSCLLGDNNPPIMPEIPAILPFNTSNIATAMPINTPPAKAE